MFVTLEGCQRSLKRWIFQGAMGMKHIDYMLDIAKVVIELKCWVNHVVLVTHYLYHLEIFFPLEVGITDIIFPL